MASQLLKHWLQSCGPIAKQAPAGSTEGSCSPHVTQTTAGSDSLFRNHMAVIAAACSSGAVTPRRMHTQKYLPSFLQGLQHGPQPCQVLEPLC